VKPIATSADGLLSIPRSDAATGRSASAVAARLAAAAAAAACCCAVGSGGTSVPAGATFPSSAKPQSSSFSAWVISVSAGQCSNVTISVIPFRLAMPT
jgi:hypothetical protein